MVLILLGFINILTLGEFLNYFCKQKKNLSTQAPNVLSQFVSGLKNKNLCLWTKINGKNLSWDAAYTLLLSI
jgi:hypothetical protein